MYSSSQAYHDIFRLDVSVYDAQGVQIVDSSRHLQAFPSTHTEADLVELLITNCAALTALIQLDDITRDPQQQQLNPFLTGVVLCCARRLATTAQGLNKRSQQQSLD